MPQSRHAVTYPIRAVSLMTGVSIDTLRAWERRYGAVVPVRDDRGRVYTEADVRRLRLLRDAVERGHAIGRVAQLPEPVLEALVSGSEPDSAARTDSASSVAPETASAATLTVRAVVQAIERFDAVTVERELARAAALLRAPDLLRTVIVPLLDEAGARWHAGRGRIAHEHLLSASIRNILGSLLRLHQRDGVPDRLLFGTPSGERHEFGTLGAAVLASAGGLGAIYVGPDMPAEELLAVAATVELDAVVLGVTNHGDTARVTPEVAAVAAGLTPRVELWLGGPGAGRLAALVPRARALVSYDDFERELVRLGARF